MDHGVLYVLPPFMFCEKTVKIGKLFGLVEPKTCQKCPNLGHLPVLFNSIITLKNISCFLKGSFILQLILFKNLLIPNKRNKKSGKKNEQAPAY